MKNTQDPLDLLPALEERPGPRKDASTARQEARPPR
jgi:hypothetical protein